MGINAVWRSETGEELGRVLDHLGHLSLIASRPADLAGTVCMRFLDPYGDTIFNQEQIAVVADEIDELASRTREKEGRAHLVAVAALARKALGHVHTYLWFIGD